MGDKQEIENEMSKVKTELDYLKSKGVEVNQNTKP